MFQDRSLGETERSPPCRYLLLDTRHDGGVWVGAVAAEMDRTRGTKRVPGRRFPASREARRIAIQGLFGGAYRDPFNDLTKDIPCRSGKQLLAGSVSRCRLGGKYCSSKMDVQPCKFGSHEQMDMCSATKRCSIIWANKAHDGDSVQSSTYNGH